MTEYITLEKLNTLLRSKKPFILMWTMDTCPDSYAVLTKFKDAYLTRGFTEKMPLYLIETIKWRTPEHKDLWNDIKNTYGLSNKLNPKFGYESGFVPSFQVFTPDGTDHVKTNSVPHIIRDMFVFQNEFVEKRLFGYYIKASYFDGVRATNYLGDYPSEINKRVPKQIVNKRNMSIRRYDINARYLTKFLDHYWRK